MGQKVPSPEHGFLEMVGAYLLMAAALAYAARLAYVGHTPPWLVLLSAAGLVALTKARVFILRVVGDRTEHCYMVLFGATLVVVGFAVLLGLNGQAHTRLWGSPGWDLARFG